MNRLYIENPKIENSKYRIRLVRKKDLNDLLKIYSNKENLKYINCDDCNGDDFYYSNLKELENKYEFWKCAYKKKWFIRMSIISKETKLVIGMCELMMIDSYDSFNDCILLRLDLLIEYEKNNVIKDIICLLNDQLLINCSYKKLITKATSNMKERVLTLNQLGFKLSNRILVGKEDNKPYKDYYVRKK